MNWKPVAGYEGAYEVSDVGLVRRVGKQPKTLTPGSHGYYVVSLWQNNKGKAEYVHRLVAIAFVDGDQSLTVNHKDGDKLNNCASNLEWISKADNTRHQWSTGLANDSGCYKHSKIQPEDYPKIWIRLAAGEKQKTIAAEYGCTQPLISWIAKKATEIH